MKSSLLGIVLIVLGALALIYQGFSYTQRERVVDIGSVHVDANKNHYVWLPPVVGVGLVAAGIVCCVASRKS